MAKVIIDNFDKLLIIDPKREFEPFREPDAIAETPEELHRIKLGIILYQPRPEVSEPEDYDTVFKWVYDTQDIFVYIDELTAVSRSSLSYPQWLRALYVQGRSRGIGILAATQRPSLIPLFTLSESRKFWKFFLLLKKDNERMAEFMGEEVEREHHAPHSFYYKDIANSMRAKEYVLDLPKVMPKTEEVKV
ncbi:MAG: hypothetical protein QXZ36_03690 [Thermoproteota archaeon]